MHISLVEGLIFLRNSMLEIITIPTHKSELHQISLELSETEIKSSELQSFIDELILTAENVLTSEGWKSAGLAAIQVSKPIRVFVAKNLTQDKFFAYINPKLELLGEATDDRLESCLSIPNFTGNVRRHKRIRISYIDRNGIAKSEQHDGFEARIIQHEFDHLQGILFTERIVS